MKKCQATELEMLINSTPDGEACELSDKEYYIERRVVIRGKKNVTLDGCGATVICKYDSASHYTSSADAFLIEDCQGLVMKNFVIDTDVAPTVTAYVESVDSELGIMTVRVDDEFPMTGREVLMALISADEQGSFDYRIHHYHLNPDPSVITLIQGEILCANTFASADYEYLGNNRFAVQVKRHEVKELVAGDKICIRYTMYGPATIALRNSDDTVLQNITMHATAGMGVMVLYRCNNLVIDGLKMLVREGSSALMSCNCDGVHITGLTGRFEMKNCYFDGLGDDALNIHSMAGTATRVDLESHTIKVNYCKKRPDGVLPAAWCRRGDKIKIFNPTTITCTGELTVEGFEDGNLTFSALSGELCDGYTLQNIEFSPSCLVENCTVKRTRARGLLFQTDNVEVRGCYFEGMSSSAIKAAPDLGFWYEVGPTNGLYIHDNHFKRNGTTAHPAPTIVLQPTHRADVEDVWGLHKNIRIENNTFEGEKNAAIELCSVDGIVIKDNTFDPSSPCPPIRLIRCRDAEIQE